MEVDEGQSNMEPDATISLMDLPERDEVLKMVLHHLNKNERRDAIQITPVFYELLCRMEKDKWCLKLNKPQVKWNYFGVSAKF